MNVKRILKVEEVIEYLEERLVEVECRGEAVIQDAMLSNSTEDLHELSMQVDGTVEGFKSTIDYLKMQDN